MTVTRLLDPDYWHRGAVNNGFLCIPNQIQAKETIGKIGEHGDVL